MSLKEELAKEIEDTRRDFHHLLDSVTEASYHHPSGNPAWTIGEVLYHITLGPPALQLEVWMIIHARRLFQWGMNDLTSKAFNKGNSLFARQGGRFTRERLRRAYERGHRGMMSSLRQVREEDLQKSITYPASFVTELAGEVTVERLFRYVKGHFDIHARQIRIAIKDAQ